MDSYASQMAAHAQSSLRFIERLDCLLNKYETESDWEIEPSPLAPLRELASQRCHVFLSRIKNGDDDITEPLTDMEKLAFAREVDKTFMLVLLQKALSFGMMSCWTDSQRSFFEILVDFVASGHQEHAMLAYHVGFANGMQETADAYMEKHNGEQYEL